MSTRVTENEYQNLIPIQILKNEIESSRYIGVKPHSWIYGKSGNDLFYTVCEGKNDMCVEPAARLWKTSDNRTIKLCKECEKQVLGLEIK